MGSIVRYSFRAAFLLLLTSCPYSNEDLRVDAALIEDSYVGGFVSNTRSLCDEPDRMRVSIGGTQPRVVSLTDAGRIMSAAEIELIQGGENLSGDLTVAIENNGLSVYYPCLAPQGWARLTVPATTMAFRDVWNPHFVQRPGQDYRLWLHGASRPVVSGIIRQVELTGEVRYEVRVSEAFELSRPDYFRVTDLDTGQGVPCNLVQVDANSPGVGITCSADARRTRLELRGWTSLAGLPVTRPNGNDPVFDVNWYDNQSVDGFSGHSIWHETQTPPFP